MARMAGLRIERNGFFTRAMPHAVALPAALAVCGLLVVAGHALGQERKGRPVLYAPEAKDFRAAYDADQSNKSRQSWDAYYGWVETFYRGNLFAAGWTSQARRLAAHVDDREVWDGIVVRLNALGRQIAQEWSKDNAIRRISSADLAAFGRQLERAAKIDNGTGSAIGKAIGEIAEVVKARRTQPADK